MSQPQPLTMSQLRVLTSDQRDAFWAIDVEPMCVRCHNEIEAVGPTIPTGAAPIQTVYRRALDERGALHLVCAVCTLDERTEVCAEAERVLAVARMLRRGAANEIARLSGQRWAVGAAEWVEEQRKAQTWLEERGYFRREHQEG